MKYKKRDILSLFILLFLTVFVSGLMAAGGGAVSINPDFTKGEKIPQGASHDWNLGPTGARGWMYSNKMETSEARQVFITKVEPKSPADSILKNGDVLLGVSGKLFAYDPRTEIGKAIGLAEASDGKLSLIRWRKNKSSEVTVKLPVLGSYSPTAPFSCLKSQRIFEQGCEDLAKRMQENPSQGHGIIRSMNALALLSSGKKEYLPIVRGQVKWAAKYGDPESRTLHAWTYGPANILLAEYTLATGDRTFIPDMERITMEIVRGQSRVGSWGHRFIREDGRLGGYGMMNATGIPLTVSLILAHKAGVRDPALDLAIKRSALLLRFYVAKGSIPYGDHHPWIQTHDDNGKNGIAAIMFNLLDDYEAAGYFSNMSIASHGSERDCGHTGNFLNLLWAMPSVALSGPNATGAWMQEFGWYYDLTRRWDGGFRHQGPPAAKPDKYKNWDCTGAYLLAYAQPLRNIFLTGKKQGGVKQLSKKEAVGVREAGMGWSVRNKNKIYQDRSDEVLFAGLRSWSPVVRERSAMALSKRDEARVDQLNRMLKEPGLHARLGACQALIHLKGRAAPAVPMLRKTLESNDLWLRVKAAEALAAIGKPAASTVPKLLAMLAEKDLERDPRGMQQRYLCFALFNSRGGLLRGSLEGVDREALFAAVTAGLTNEDGRARGAIASVYKNLKYEEIKPLLPAIYQAVVEPAPSGIMFASGIRLSGLEILAKHRIEEGMLLCFDVMAIDKWGKKARIGRCLKILQTYGGSARPMLPRLKELEKHLILHRETKSLQREIDQLRKLITIINKDKNTPTLRSING